MAAYIVDDTGIHVPSVEEVLDDVLAVYISVFGDDLALQPQTPQLQLAAVQALSDLDYGEALNSVRNAMTPDRAVGTELDDYGSVLNIDRRTATRSTVDATLTGVTGTAVPAGSRARTSDGAEFATDVAATLSSSGVAVPMTATKDGAVAAAVGTLTQIVTTVDGWEQVTNPAAATLGRDSETDASYRASYLRRTARAATGPIDALRAALEEALAGKQRVVERNDSTDTVIQQFKVVAHSVLAVASEGSATDLTRAVETHRGMGQPTMTAIHGGTPAAANAFTAITDGTVTWLGSDYTGLDLSATSTGTERAAALTTLLDGTGVTVAWIDGIYVAQFAWHPDTDYEFGTGTVETAFGFDPDNADGPYGPFVRSRTKNLGVTVTGTRSGLFPGDGLDQTRTALVAVADSYDLGATPYLNDFLAAAQTIIGLQVTTISVQHNSVDVSAVAPSLDTLWALPNANIDLSAVT